MKSREFSQDSNILISSQKEAIRMLTTELNKQKRRKLFLQFNLTKKINELKNANKKIEKQSKMKNGGCPIHKKHVCSVRELYSNLPQNRDPHWIGDYHRKLICPVNHSIYTLFDENFIEKYKNHYYFLEILYTVLTRKTNRHIRGTLVKLVPIDIKRLLVFGLSETRICSRLNRYKETYEKVRKKYLDQDRYWGKKIVHFSEVLHITFIDRIRKLIQFSVNDCMKQFKPKNRLLNTYTTFIEIVSDYDQRLNGFSIDTRPKACRLLNEFLGMKNRMKVLNPQLFVR